MKPTSRILTIIISLAVCTTLSAVEDWPVWRGPNRNAIAPANQSPPTKWSEDENVIWKTEVPGRGHASPIIVGNRIFLSTADDQEQSQSVVCFDRETGKQLWDSVVHTGGFPKKIHGNNTHASATMSASGNRVFVNYYNNDSILLAALDFDGEVLWKKNTGAFFPRFPFGYGSSLCVYNDLVIVMSDYSEKGYLAAYKQSDGTEAWRTKRGHTSSFATPIIATIKGKDQVLVSGSELRSYDPSTGEENWHVPIPQWIVSCGTPVWQDDTVFVSGGFPKPGTYAISASKHSIVWENRVKAYEQSLLVHDGYVYCHNEKGVAYCWRASDGEEMWKARATPGRVSASPVLVGDLIFMTGENGQTAVIKANPEKFELVSKNKLGGSAFATPAFLDSKIYTRVADSKNSPTQYLYCLGTK